MSLATRGEREVAALISPRLLVAAFALIVTFAGPSPAQEEDEPAEPPPPVAHVSYDDNDFLRWVFENRSEADGREWFETQLDLNLEELDRACALDGPQKLKLRLAGRGDIKRFYDLLEQKRKRFHAIKSDENEVQTIFQDIEPLHLTLFRGPFGAGSIFAKTLRSTLSPEQVARYERLQRARTLFRHRAKLELLVESLDKIAGLTEDQRTKLGEVVAASCPPGRAHHFEYYLLLYRTASLPDDALRPIFDDSQWAVVRRRLDEAKELESVLETVGLLPAEKDGPDAEARRPEHECGPGHLPEGMP